MKLYDETAHGFRAIAYELTTLEKAYRQRDKLRKKDIQSPTPRGRSMSQTGRACISFTRKKDK